MYIVAAIFAGCPAKRQEKSICQGKQSAARSITGANGLKKLTELSSCSEKPRAFEDCGGILAYIAYIANLGPGFPL